RISARTRTRSGSARRRSRIRTARCRSRFRRSSSRRSSRHAAGDKVFNRARHPYPGATDRHRTPMMPVSRVWDRLVDAGPAWIVLVFAAPAMAVVPVLRSLAPVASRRRGGPAVLLLGISVVFSATAIVFGGMGGASAGNVVQLLGLLALAVGLV